MSKAPDYNELIFQLGDLARERLAAKPARPRAMDRVFRAEDSLLQLREDLETLEREMNAEDEAHRALLEDQALEKKTLAASVKRHQRAVDGVEGRTRDLRKQLASKRATMRYERSGLKQAEAKHKDLSLAQQHDVRKVETSAENLKKLRVILMRKQREIEELEAELHRALTPRPGQPGEEGLLAHKRLLEIEDQTEANKHTFEDQMAALDESIAAKEAAVAAAEDYLDQALFLLGEECYAQRLADPALSAFYPKIDKVR